MMETHPTYVLYKEREKTKKKTKKSTSQTRISMIFTLFYPKELFGKVLFAVIMYLIYIYCNR